VESNTAIENIEPESLHLEVLPIITKKAFFECLDFDFLDCSLWYLAGGTALGLEVGHRRSVDLDFFSPQGKLDLVSLERELLNTQKWKTTLIERGTLYGELSGAKMSFIAYPFFLPSKTRIACGKICLLTAFDIAAMKIIAISQRGRKRDFVDLYWYCMNREGLASVIGRAMRQYPGQNNNIQHILKSLVYFADAEEDPMPEIFFKADWRTIKAYFQREVPKIAKELLGI